MPFPSFRPAPLRAPSLPGAARLTAPGGGPASRALRAGVLTLAGAYGLLVPACSDDSDPVTAVGGSAGSGNGGSGGSAGSSNMPGSGGSGGSPGGSGSGGSGGSAGSSSMAGGGGSAGMGEPDAGPDSGGPDAGALAFELSSPAFDDNPGCSNDNRAACDLFPDENTNLGDAENVSPEINWTPGPPGTQSYAIAMHDLSFSMGGGDPFTHWVMWNIPALTTGLVAELPAGSSPPAPAPPGSQQINYNGGFSYIGSGACGNVYEFVLYALNVATFTPDDDSDGDAVEAELEASDAVLDTTTMRARSDPNGPSCN